MAQGICKWEGVEGKGRALVCILALEKEVYRVYMEKGNDVSVLAGVRVWINGYGLHRLLAY